jgi:hypothetical protein
MEGPLSGSTLEITAREAIALAIAIGAVAALLMALWGRIKEGKGIGWQFIRFNAIVLALPLTAVLALTNSLSASSATILAGALGYAFGRPGDEEKPNA